MSGEGGDVNIQVLYPVHQTLAGLQLDHDAAVAKDALAKVLTAIKPLETA